MEHEHIHKSNSANNTKMIAGAIIIAGVLIAGAILLKGSNATGNTADGANKLADIKIKVNSEDHILGNPEAKIMIVTYSDSECPFCKVFYNTMIQVTQKYGDQIAWVYKQYPIDQLHPKARKESEASECAWDQGGNEMFWKYIGKIFEITPANNRLDPAELTKIAEGLGLDMPTFTTCLDSGKFAQKVQTSIDDGSAVGVNGTPSSFILKKGKVVDNIPGALPVEAVSQKLDTLLK